LNWGGIYYTLYTTSTHDGPGPVPPYDPTGPYPFGPGPWGGCNQSCTQPGSFWSIAPFSLGSISFGSLGTVTFPTISIPLPNVGGWVDYARCAMTVYLSWCPSHTQILLATINNLRNREPFGTFSEMADVYMMLGSDVDTMSQYGGENNFAPRSVVFGGDSGGQEGPVFPGLFPVLSDDSPWKTGNFDLQPALDQSGGGDIDMRAAYVDYCQSVFISRLGMSAWGFCSILGLSRYAIGDTFWLMIQFAADVSLLIGFFLWVKHNWVDTGAQG
jgi:hypothetical protein